ncbi:MAG: hypothetical protein IH628_08745 [Proteobacteria bacterium]|nr:hypothetical protein [Pseudomonadota bacterium]
MRHRRTRKRRVAIVLSVVFIALCLLLVSSIIAFKATTPEPEYAYRAADEQEDFVDANFERQGKWYGLCAKNSIHSVDDFRRTVSNDPVLKAHYGDFQWENAKMGRLDEATLAYVHFRKDDRIFLTKKPIRLPPGDEYITDGYTRVRTFCCNNYTIVPPFNESSDLLAELSGGPSLYDPPGLLVGPSAIPPAEQSPEHVSPLSSHGMQLAWAPPLGENGFPWSDDAPFFASTAKEDGAGEPAIATQPEETPFSTSPPQEYGYGGTTTLPQSYPTPTSIIPDDGGGGNDGGGEEPKPIPEAATILLVGVGVAASFIVFFIGKYYTRRCKTPGHRT